MEIPLKDPAGEIKRLQRCIDDLIGVASLPALWAGGEPSQILSTLLDRLLEILRLDLAFVRLNDSMGGGPIEMVRGQSRETTAPQEIGEMLSRRAICPTVSGAWMSISMICARRGSASALSDS